MGRHKPGWFAVPSLPDADTQIGQGIMKLQHEAGVMKNDVSVTDRRSGIHYLACLLVAACALVAPARADAQRSHEFTLDLRPFGGSIGFAQRITPGVMLGVAAGGGIDALDRTFAPDPAQLDYRAFEQIVHVSAFLRQSPTPRLDVDLGLRLGVGGVRECDASDCSPGAFFGLTAGAFWGSNRVKLGPRMLFALARESGKSNPVLYAELLTLRIKF